MTKIMKLFSLLFMFVFSMCFALSDRDSSSNTFDKYRLSVTKVDPEFHCFELSNGMICNTIKNEWESERLPDVGAEIFLIPAIRFSQTKEEKIEKGEFGVFHFQNIKDKRLGVWISEESKQDCLSYVSTQLVCTQPAGWLFSAVNENVIELSDGSKWISKEVPDFDQGDCAIVTRDIEDDQWYIIDVSRERFWGTDRRLVVFYNRVEVKPYNPEEITKE